MMEGSKIFDNTFCGSESASNDLPRFKSLNGLGKSLKYFANSSSERKLEKSAHFAFKNSLL